MRFDHNSHVGNEWIPVNGAPARPAVDGVDIRTTIDVRIQEAAETELREFEFYAFVSAQLNQFMDKEYDVDEENAKKLVAMAAEMLRDRKQECDV